MCLAEHAAAEMCGFGNDETQLQSTTDCFVLSVLASQDHSNLVLFIILEKGRAMNPRGTPVPSLVSQSNSTLRGRHRALVWKDPPRAWQRQLAPRTSYKMSLLILLFF